MNKKAAFITIHGMGKTDANYSADLFTELSKRLKEKADCVHLGSVYYQGILQPNEERVWAKVQEGLGWSSLREFLLFGIADAAGLESGKEKPGSVYEQAQVAIAKELWSARNEVGEDSPVVFLAHSLGCQVLSCYLWDASQSAAGKPVSVGIWKDINAFGSSITGGSGLPPGDITFLQGKTLRTLFTTGCNIPVFVAAHAKTDIRPFPKPNDTFAWHNFYDKDDVLGWPLTDLSDEYKSSVFDKQVNAGGGVWGWITKSWNPMSHNQYWADSEILDPLEAVLRSLA